ncbi:hypothetical protein PSTT_15960, partial [Puccinia striiformis]
CARIRSPIEDALNRLDRYQAAAELSRRTSRIVYTLAKRLKAQMAELDQKPFQNHSDHDTPHHPGITIRLISQRTAYSIRSLKVIQPHVQRIVSARKKVEEQMSKILNQELVQLDLPMLSTSFQTAYNLSILVRSVGSLLFELTDLVAKKNELALNLNSLAKEAVANVLVINRERGLSPHRTFYHTGHVHYGLDQRGLINDLSTSGVKSGERYSTVFWTNLGSASSKESRETLRNFRYTYGRHITPEISLTLRAIIALENIYLNQSVSKMNEAANNSRVDKLTTTVNNGIDAARFDTLLPRSVTGESQEVIKNYFKQMKSRIISNYQLKSLVGPVATTSQITHIEICNTLSDLSCILLRSIRGIKKIIYSPIELTEKIQTGMISPLVVSTKQDLNMIASMMHNHSRPPPSFNSTTNQLKLHASLITPSAGLVKIRLARDLAELEFEVLLLLLLLLLLVMACLFIN